MATLRMIGLNDTVNKCDCCGKQNLKKTIVLTESEDVFPSEDEVYFYGSQCAVTALRNQGIKGFKNQLTNSEVLKKAKQAEVDHRNQQQDKLIADKKVILISGRYLLPDVDLDVLDIESEIERRNTLYPCFA